MYTLQNKKKKKKKNPSVCLQDSEDVTPVLSLFSDQLKTMADALDRPQSSMVRANMSPHFPCGSEPAS